MKLYDIFFSPAVSTCFPNCSRSWWSTWRCSSCRGLNTTRCSTCTSSSIRSKRRWYSTWPSSDRNALSFCCARPAATSGVFCRVADQKKQTYKLAPNGERKWWHSTLLTISDFFHPNFIWRNTYYVICFIRMYVLCVSQVILILL